MKTFVCWFIIPQTTIKVKLLDFRERQLVAFGIVGTFIRIAMAILVCHPILVGIVSVFTRIAGAILQRQQIAVGVVGGTEGKVRTEFHDKPLFVGLLYHRPE
jgi:hypothetical protein